MEKYNPNKIEKKWSEKWVKEKTFISNLANAKNPYYALFMFPYPSAEGLHVGNFYAFTSVDVMTKYMKLKGFDIFEPVGWDAFGIHSENYALKIGETPSKMLERTIKNFRLQLQEAGLSCDWTMEINTTSPQYYRWTQWIFLKLFEKGLAYQKEALVNWCPDCKTVLADEQIEADGTCERCRAIVEKRKMKQWFFKITDYAERLLNGLEDMDWSEITKSAQKNWIGKSEGAEIDFKVFDSKCSIRVFTTRPDTLFGCTYLVLSPEYDLVEKIVTSEQKKEVEQYIKETAKKSELERKENKEKTGVFTGAYAINPINEEKVPIWIADYVLSGYGTGAIMAVPAHDERDYEFAKKFNLQIKQVIAPHNLDESNPPREGKENTVRKVVHVILENAKGEVLTLNLKGEEWGSDKPKTLIIGGIEDGESLEDAAKREIKEETGFIDVEFVKTLPIEFHAEFFAAHKNVNRYVKTTGIVCSLKSDKQISVSEKEKKLHDIKWVKKEKLSEIITIPDDQYLSKAYVENIGAYSEGGVLINSGEFDGQSSKEAHDRIVALLNKRKMGEKKINYKLRDWCISRQRYWGPPIPIVYCEKCGTVGVNEEDLPAELPELKEGWQPAGDGRGPLAKVESFIKTTCPRCGGLAEREPDVMDNFLDSAWYFFRYISPNDSQEIFDKKIGKKWLPVDFYVGGNEHAVLHLMYTRFITMFLHDIGVVDFDNPFKKFRANGMILKDGKKMSKSKGNVVNPEEYGRKIGYDALKTYLLFLGPLSEDRSFSDSGINGTRNWAERIFNLFSRIEENGYKDSKEMVIKLNQTIKFVEDAMDNQKYNTAIAKLMGMTNTLYSSQKISDEIFKKFLVMVSIFLPALSEELWEKLGNSNGIFNSNWPKYDENLIKTEEIEMVVQVNGKLRDRIFVAPDVTEDEAKETALESEKIRVFTKGKKIKKIIFIPEKLINIVII